MALWARASFSFYGRCHQKSMLNLPKCKTALVLCVYYSLLPAPSPLRDRERTTRNGVCYAVQRRPLAQQPKRTCPIPVRCCPAFRTHAGRLYYIDFYPKAISSFSSTSSAHIAAILTISCTPASRSKIYTGLLIPTKIGPTASASPTRISNL